MGRPPPLCWCMYLDGRFRASGASRHVGVRALPASATPHPGTLTDSVVLALLHRREWTAAEPLALLDVAGLCRVATRPSWSSPTVLDRYRPDRLAPIAYRAGH